MSMEQLILVRHCQTDLLASGDPGLHRNDSPLSKLGLKQAAQIANFLDKYEYDVVFSSLFIRAIKTAEIINTKKKTHLRSISLGEYFIGDDGEGRETTGAGITRTMAFIYPMFDTYGSVILVGHNSINSTILRSFLNMEFGEAENYFQTVGEVVVVRRDWKKGDKAWHIIDKFSPEQK
jgi:broad specificity phosphatase PhoE